MTPKTFTLPAGTVCQRGGVSFVLMSATLVECHPAAWPLIRDGFQPGAHQVERHLERTARQIAGLQP